MSRKKAAEQTATGGRTDKDGANDGWEVANNFNPLVYNSTFNVTISLGYRDDIAAILAGT